MRDKRYVYPYPESLLETKISEHHAARLMASAGALAHMAASNEARNGGMTLGRARQMAIDAGFPERYVDEAIKRGLYWESLELEDAFEGKKWQQVARTRKWVEFYMDSIPRFVLNGFTHKSSGLSLELYMHVQKVRLDVDVCQGDNLFYHLSAMRGFRRLKKVVTDDGGGYGERFWPVPGTKIYIRPSEGILPHREYVDLGSFVSSVVNNDVIGMDTVKAYQIIRHVVDIPRIVSEEVRQRMARLDGK
ncbi:hypothetical protein KY363_01575 [Candidatus Woesearchaeota archaeon]|nr:hypothetical protein [Candidatus Woesearchaeota archaeon]